MEKNKSSHAVLESTRWFLEEKKLTSPRLSLRRNKCCWIWLLIFHFPRFFFFFFFPLTCVSGRMLFNFEWYLIGWAFLFFVLTGFDLSIYRLGNTERECWFATDDRERGIMNSNNHISHIAHPLMSNFLRFPRFLETGFVYERASRDLIVIDDHGSWVVVCCPLFQKPILAPFLLIQSSFVSPLWCYRCIYTVNSETIYAFDDARPVITHGI